MATEFLGIGRTWLGFIILVLLASALLWLGKLDGGTYAMLTGGTFATAVTGKTFEKSKLASSDLPPEKPPPSEV